MTMIEPTIEEKERQDEFDLLQNIDNLNKNYKKLWHQKISNNGKNKENSNPNDLVLSSPEGKDNDSSKNFAKRSMSFFDFAEDSQTQSLYLNLDNSYSNLLIQSENENLINGQSGSTIEMMNIKLNDQVNSTLKSKNSTGPNTISTLEGSGNGMGISNMEAFLNQNLINFEDILNKSII